MRIDPVVALVDELETAYIVLARARGNGDRTTTRTCLAKIANLHTRLRAAEPASVVGAAHLLREAASRLPRPGISLYGDELHRIATRLDEGQRRISDLVWLRRAAASLSAGASGHACEDAAGLIARALKGAAKPILLYRAVPIPLSQHRKPARSEWGVSP